MEKTPAASRHPKNLATATDFFILACTSPLCESFFASDPQYWRVFAA
ncbi:MAG: hypothetical protein SFX18_01760 [Pirellulales bacterium]|nr:hypothetical protein [Pirellulales bacterium]